MNELRIETLHVDDDNIPKPLLDVVEAAATTDTNEGVRAGVVVALLGELPIAAVTIGRSPNNERIVEVRNVVLCIPDKDVAIAGLEIAWANYISRAPLLSDGVYVNRAVMPKAISEDALANTGIKTIGFDGVSASEVDRLVSSDR